MQTVRSTTKHRVNEYRERMRARGFRQINLWVPDTRAPAFARECRRQSLLAAKLDSQDDILDGSDQVAADTEGWTA